MGLYVQVKILSFWSHKKGASLHSSLFFSITIKSVWEITTQRRLSTSNTNLNLGPVHVWELVALNGIPSASPLVRWSTTGGRHLKKDVRVVQQCSFCFLHLSNHRAHTTTLVEPQELWSNSWQALGPLIYFYHWLKTAFSFPFTFKKIINVSCEH